mmetsp:Transcript_11121/g.31516  ORF Transcript_11121/g.31516 Transcript_11121/m.31516 type:complete len:291 (-) Transcript_11121:773-1645(-)
MAAGLVRAVYMVSAGAIGAYVFQNAETVSEVFGEVSRAVVHALSKPNSAKSSERSSSSEKDGTVAMLTQQVDQLTRELRRLASRSNERQITYIGAQEGTSAGARVIQLCVLVGGSYVYLRLRGYTLQDFMYVTRASLHSTVEAVNTSLESVKGKLQVVRAEIEKRIHELSNKHDQNTAAIRSQLDTQIAYVNTQIAELGDAQGYANQGIYLLTRVVAETMAGSNSRAAKELEAFAQSRPALVFDNGLRSVVSMSDADAEEGSGVLAQRHNVLRGNIENGSYQGTGLSSLS